MRLVLEIPRVPVSPNDLLGYHWRHRERNCKLWQEEVNYTLLQTCQRPGVPFTKAQVIIERCSRGELDEDNLHGSVKPIIDALRYACVLVDDSPKHMTLTVTQRRIKRGEQPHTKIEILPV